MNEKVIEARGEGRVPEGDEATARRRLDEVRHALFPPPVPRDDGSEVDHSADENIEAAIISLKHRNADKVSIGTLNKILSRLVAARAILDAAPPAPAPEGEWRSISTIPDEYKDGRTILAAFEGTTDIRRVCLRWEDGRWVLGKRGDYVMTCKKAKWWWSGSLPAPPVAELKE